MPSIAFEDYLKCIYKLEDALPVDNGGRGVSTSSIAERLGISQASVTAMLKKLAERGLVRHERYQGAMLTDEGRRIAVEMIRRHRIIELFLVRMLGLRWDEVDAEAEVLEHAFSEKVVNRLWDVLGRPDADPHGSPIPPPNALLQESRALVPLSEAPLDSWHRIARLQERRPEELRYLAEHALHPGASVRVVEVAPFKGPLLIEVEGRLHPLDLALADAIFVHRS
ncbi:MAG: metal-dependent transcriptional regulator [Halothiobacillaceae bacterium]|jgi:DtxR family Mn-dependent transcriptional regulator|nr:metal-dependent transcriptional regulator [Halothiobacillaceae bacterium]MDY0049340.1 metal-dependent transcriptional regulator [Halothiobacillaceae bacterium]